MKFSILVLASPYSSQGSFSALKFAQACLNNNHDLYRVFFYHDGVLSTSNLQAPPTDEITIHEEWKALANEHQIDMVVCIAAALKRGVLNDEEANRYSKPQYNLEAPFELSGLGQLLDAQIHSDRLVTFK